MHLVLKQVTESIAQRALEGLENVPENERKSLVSRAQRKLIGEAKSLGFAEPCETELEDWFTEAHVEYLMGSGSVDGAMEPLAVIEKAQSLWRSGQVPISAALFHAWRFTPSLTQYEASRKRHPHPAVVAFDCDGVLYDFNGTLREWLVSRGWDRNQLPNPTVYSLADAWGLHDKHLQVEIANAVTSGKLWNVGHALYDGVSAAKHLGVQGHTIIVNTARRIPGLEAESLKATLVWLRSHGIHPDGLHLADPRDPFDKLAVDFDIILDDHAANVSTALLHGRDALLIDRPWNGNEIHVPRATFAEAIRAIDRQRMPMPVR